MSERPIKRQLDLTRIFLSPPRNLRELSTLLAMMLVCFILFFMPLLFTEMSPVKAVIISVFPTLSLSWGWTVLLRYLFSRSAFLK